MKNEQSRFKEKVKLYKMFLTIVFIAFFVHGNLYHLKENVCAIVENVIRENDQVFKLA